MSSSRAALQPSQDEFDALPDEFDFSAVVEPPPVPSRNTNNAQPLDEYDMYNEFDSFADIDLDAIAELGPPQPAPQPPVAAQPAVRVQAPMPQDSMEGAETASVMSTQYTFDEVDDAFMQEVAAIERRAISLVVQPAAAPPAGNSQTGSGSVAPTQVPASTSRRSSEPPRSASISRNSALISVNVSTTRSRGPSTVAPSLTDSQLSSRTSIKRKRSTMTEDCDHTSKKIRNKAKSKHEIDPRTFARELLCDTEESLLCPICHDIFVAPHVAISCGHSYCGECMVRWMKFHGLKERPSCPTCRAQLVEDILIVQNFSLGEAVSKHIEAMAKAGLAEWQPTGERYVLWLERNATWNELNAELPILRQAQWAPSQSQAPPNNQLANPFQNQGFHIHIDDTATSDDDESDQENDGSDLFDYFSTPPASALNSQ